MNKILCSPSHHPHFNVALEEDVLFQAHQGVTLYLWKNEPTVVIGHNQNAWAECDPEELAYRGIHLARRLSGGGAVYHDLGQMNFTFACKESCADSNLWQRIILSAVATLGLIGEASGRNDLLCQGRKFSGQAMYAEDGYCYHHGTILVNTNLESMEAALRPSRVKLEKRGIDSVRSRVVNLAELVPGLTVETMQQAVQTAFAHVYPCPGGVEMMAQTPKRLAHYESQAWNWGEKPTQRERLELHTGKSTVQLWLEIQEGHILSARFYTDGLQSINPGAVEELLVGMPADKTMILQSLQAMGI